MLPIPRVLRRHDPHWLCQRGERLYALKRYRRAARTFRKAARRVPHVADVYARRGLCLAALNHPQRAARILEQALTLAAEKGATTIPPWLSEVAYQAGIAHERLNEPYLALRCYEKALAAQPENIAEILYRRTKLYLHLGYYDRARHDLDRLASLLPHEASHQL